MMRGYPYRSHKVWHIDLDKHHIPNNKEKSQKCDHVGSQPKRKYFDECIPLDTGVLTSW